MDSALVILSTMYRWQLFSNKDSESNLMLIYTQVRKMWQNADEYISQLPTVY